jgi:hypothetical protein
LVLSGLSLAASGLAQRPPRDLHLVGDHWTAWNPPEEIPEGAQVHTIEAGDTLWDLAQQFLGDPYLWPQIWERNQYILDAHWIYPGDPLLMGLEVQPGEDVLGEEEQPTGEEAIAEAEEAPLPGLEGRKRQVSPFVQLGTPDDIYCSGFIGAPKEEFAYTITGSEYDSLGPSLKPGEGGKIRAHFGVADTVKVGLELSDIVYVDGGRERGLTPGDTLVAVDARQIVHHPHTNREVGRLYAYLGRVRILSVQADSAIGEIVQSCHPMTTGAHLRPFEPEPIPSERRTPMRPVNQPTTADRLAEAAVILRAKDDLLSVGQDHVVFIDRGTDDEITPGDIFTVYRLGKKGNPPVVLGELAVLSVHSRSSIGKIITSRYPIYIGDVLEPK